MAKAKAKAAATPKDDSPQPDICPQCTEKVGAEDAITYLTHGPFCGVDCVKVFQAALSSE